MLRLLVDTSTWLDLAKRRDGQRWIVAIRVLAHKGAVELLVPSLVVDEFERNRERVEESMTTSVAQRFKLIKQDLDLYGGSTSASAAEVLESLAHEVPLIGAMTTRNFRDVLDLLRKGSAVEATDDDLRRVVERGLAKQAPFHRRRNSVGDALLIELYATQIAAADLSETPHAFVTSNSEDFSRTQGDNRDPHPDLEALFSDAGSAYGLGVDGLHKVIAEHFGEELEQLLVDSDFAEEPRRLDQITAAEQMMFDLVWHHRSAQYQTHLHDEARYQEERRHFEIARRAREEVEAKYLGLGLLGPHSDYDLGMLEGKLSALRWVLGSEWDFLDT